jgi:hypothetical protein
MNHIVLDVPAGQVSAELSRRGVASHVRVHVQVEVIEEPDVPMAVIAQDGKAFDWLASEPELYSDSDLMPGAG